MGNTIIADVSAEETATFKEVGSRILQVVRAEVAKNKVAFINYDDHCDWHDAGGDCGEG